MGRVGEVSGEGRRDEQRGWKRCMERVEEVNGEDGRVEWRGKKR